jgi:serine/threonine protein kinase
MDTRMNGFPFTPLPECFSDYTMIKRTGPRLCLLERNGECSAVKVFPLNYPGIRELFDREREAFSRLRFLEITPILLESGTCNNVGYLRMECYQESLSKLILSNRLTSTQKRTIVNQVNAKIDRMHAANLGHGDLHGDNVMVNVLPDRSVETAIIDFEHSYDLDTGKTDPRVISWRDDAFDWNDTYEAFIKYDYENWRSEMN